MLCGTWRAEERGIVDGDMGDRVLVGLAVSADLVGFLLNHLL